MKPSLETFRESVEKYRGNLSKVARAFGVTRTTVGLWVAGSEEWKQIVKDARMRLFDDCLVAGELLAIGIPVKDDDGKFIGWDRPPDGQMLRYFLSTLGRDEGFTDTPETATDKVLETKTPEVKVQIVYNSKEDLELQKNAHVVQEQEGEEQKEEE